ncbi:MAG: hypothetical protein AABY22_09425, partial [Nanoarchaeota archaeon]
IDRVWKNEKFIKKVLKGLLKRPTSFEETIQNIVVKNNLNFRYTGNGDYLINFKNPDFINEKEKIAIEVFHSWFKIRDYGSIEGYKDFCKSKYEPKGWKVVFIDENELKDENLVMQKIKEFDSNA